MGEAGPQYGWARRYAQLRQLVGATLTSPALTALLRPVAPAPPLGEPLAEPAVPTFAAAEQAHEASLWIGYWLPAEVASQIALPGGESPPTLHLTLGYFGLLADLPADAVERAAAALSAFAFAATPIELTLNGVARFEGQHGGPDVLYATVCAPELASFRAWLLEACATVGLMDRLTYQGYDFTPHVTLAYLTPDQAAPPVTLPNVTLRLDRLTLSTRTTTQVFPLVGNHLGGDYALTEFPPVPAGATAFELRFPQAFAEIPEWLPVLPKPGSYAHPRYGDILITAERNARFVTNFANRVYAQSIAIDAEHESKLGGAFGYIEALEQNPDGSVRGRVSWTDQGRAAIAADRFQNVSPEWYDEWERPVDRQRFQDVLIGLALTTRPFFKNTELPAIGAGEAPLVRVPALALTEVPPTADSTHTAEEAVMPEDKDPKDVEIKQPPNPPVPPPPPAAATETQAFSELQRQLTEQQRQFAELKLVAEQQAERLKAQELTAQTRRFTDEVRGKTEANALPWIGDVAGHVTHLTKLAQAFGGEDAPEVLFHVTTQRANAAQHQMLFREIGTNAVAATGSAEARIEALVHQLTEADPKLTVEAAWERASERNPQLYREYRAERGLSRV